MIAVLHIVTLFKLFQVRRADIEWYIGEDEPPYCEMTLRAAGAEGQRGDLRFGATLKETEISPIMIERTYEPLSANTITHPEPTNTVTISRAAETSHNKGVAVKKYQHSIDLCKYNYFNLLYQLKLMLALLLQVQLQTLS